MEHQSVSVDVVAKRLCDLLQSFPAAAISGVQWQTLSRKYAERYSSRLNIHAMGFDSALTAASTLLWDVVRFVNTEDVDNPVLALENNVVLTPSPGSLATWPSLYQAFYSIASQHGTVERVEDADDKEPARGLLLSKLKPLLQSHWHPEFNESGLCYLNEAGTGVQLKKMKHLVQAVLRWRSQHLEEVASSQRHCSLRAALMPNLELVVSQTHNDMTLRYVPTAEAVSGPVVSDALGLGRGVDLDTKCTDSEDIASVVSASGSSSGSASLEQELAILRLENAALRSKNEQLQHQEQYKQQCPQSSAVGRVALHDSFMTQCKRLPVEMEDIFDNPFEPPPEARLYHTASTTAGSSIADPNDVGFSSVCGTPRSALSSGASTPVRSATSGPFQLAGFGVQGQLCAFVPIWFDRTGIPCGIVQQAKSIFDRPGASIPSFFT